MDSDIIIAVSSSLSAAETIRKLERAIVGSNYRWLYREIDRLSLPTDHWKKNGGKGRKQNDQIFVKGGLSSTGTIKRVILKNDLINYECALCGMGTIWNDLPLVLRLDHINGISDDNRIENLRFLCPNCDSQSPFFCGRNRGRNRYKDPEPYVVKFNICACGKKILSSSKSCKSCAGFDRRTKIDWPEVNELCVMVQASSYSEVGRQLGVSGVAVKAHIGRRRDQVRNHG